MTKTGEDGGGWHITQPGIIVGQESSMTKMGEDGGGWHRTPTWHHSWTKEFYDKEGRRWRRMAQNPDLASQLDKRVL